jgi:hypothetical protein
VLLTTLGWAAGAVVVGALASRTAADGLGVFLLTVFVAVAVPVAVLATIRRDMSWLRARDRDQRPSIVWVLIGVSFAQAVATAVLPYTGGWAPLQAWAAVYPLLLLAILIEVVPRYARPMGWAGSKAEERRLMPILLLVGLVSTFIVAWVTAETTMARVREPCDPTIYYCVPDEPWQAALAPTWLGGWSAIAVAAFALRLRFIAITAIAMATFGYGFWAQDVWSRINIGGAAVDPLQVAVIQVIGAAALIGAAGVIEIYEQRDRTPRELRVLRWFGAGGPPSDRSGLQTTTSEEQPA